ncbi:hypothetical protein [Novosphingobium sp. 9U]|uniref:hypothetical protein n=1 Tax=Novosphingobium sp. 9U TaxID=2653158 RepID=UPI0012EF70F6|nr:hypothetical protein NOVOSPHI9U_370056 [Novosphingobium sp. 9U]
MPASVIGLMADPPTRACDSERAPVVLSYGMGVDSTALLVELVSRGQAPDLVLTADPGAEKPESYAYLEMMRSWMADRGIRHEVVRYVTKRFKHFPAYKTYPEACSRTAVCRV